MSKVIVDQAARNKIKSELTTNYLIEAGAGSGKTTSLVERMVNLIYTDTCKIEQMVAITFTRKAADELKLRFQSELENKWEIEIEELQATRLSDALQNMERCFIGTVHAFCSRLLRERPIEAKLDLTFQELEEQDDYELLEEAWHTYLLRLQEFSPTRLKEMDELGLEVDDLFTCLKDMKNYPDVEWVTSHVNKPALEETYNYFMTLIKEAKRSLPEKEPDKGYDALQKAMHTSLIKQRHGNASNPRHIIDIFELFNKNLKPTYNRWDSKEDAKFYYEKITSVVDQSIKRLLQTWWEYCHPKVINFLIDAMDDYEQLKRERSLLNYQDLLIKTNQLLKGNEEVRYYFQQKYKCLLVDEFQDTDPIQAEIMFFLTGENLDEQVWTKCKPRPGSLFVVGGPKQAIYRFRRADIDTYNRVKQLIEAHGGEVLQLTMNFRTVNTITEKLNTIFQHMLPNTETVYQAAYRPLHAFKTDDQSRLSGIKRITIPDDYSRKDDVVQQDAENIATYIQSLLKEGYHAKDFLVLTRYNDGIATYAQTIEDRGIPVSVSGEIVIGETREFQELLTLFQTFVDPTDQVALVAALRGAFFGVSDNDLYQWKQAGGRFSIYSLVPRGLIEPIKAKFELALSKLALYQKWIRALPPTAAMEQIMEDVGFYALLIKNKHGKRSHKSLLQILEALRASEVNGITTYKSVCDVFAELVMEKTVVANLEEDADAVRVMNVHKAKGLEAPIVFLSHPIKMVNAETFLSKYIKREDDHSKGYYSFSVKKGFQSKMIALPVNWSRLKMEELRYLLEEEIRIVYVAATRAEKALVISSSAKSDNKNPWKDLLQMESIEEVVLPEHDLKEKNQKELTISLDHYESETKARLDWLELKKQPTYKMWSPTDDKDFAEVASLERESAGGRAWGTLIHNVLEKVVQGVDVHHFIQNAMVKHSIPTEREQEVYDYIRLWKHSDIWNELDEADQVLTEVPFNLKLEPQDPLYTVVQQGIESSTIYVKGVIDLVYLKDGAWTIVDYKTDRVKKEEDFSKLRDYYKGQVIFYKHAWGQMTGEKVNEVKLFFFAEQLQGFVK
ncbi:UvrD-helicase domain-containing protein [Aquibacillus koreensis]|uniref:DNA 3'-5' helicase n=1 Tax=Aquibacillus koreensis TaxID=279446 RepID=A0A9X4AK33_9BACI|nr:UvrD-helicase domain-containing protein [Aquibacillus koreensis]MCT2537670.1 UvrD-helicase domain-containing protein [Aquibacillus koreensis]MDC3420983.1 UvrD-helicase domain-containing protein [Aquibacillus koreensis]